MRALRLVCDVTTAELFSKGVQAKVTTMRGGQGCHRLALPENLLVSNKTIPVTKLQYNECRVRRETGDCSHVPDPNSWLRNELSSLRQWQVQALGLTRDTWHVARRHGECQVAQTNIGLLIARAIAAWLLVFAQPQHTDRDHWQMECLFCCQMSDISTPAQEHKYVDNIQIYDQ